MEKVLEDLGRRIRCNSSEVLIFTGAGMSTESGVPDFRSPNGIWRKADIGKVATPEGFSDNPELFLEFYRSRLAEMITVLPNIGHKTLAEWEKQRLVKAIITQNIDRLHHSAGSTKVLELHGNLSEVRCRACRQVFDSRLLLSSFRCKACKDYVRPQVVLFGEPLPREAFTEAEKLSREAKIFLVLGSSLEVAPANLFPEIAKESGSILGIINKSPTHLDSAADFVIHRGIGETLQELDRIVSGKFS